MLLDVELLGFSDLVSLFGVSKTRVEQIVRKPGFPETHYVGAKRTRVWERDAVLAWARDSGRHVTSEDSADGN